MNVSAKKPSTTLGMLASTSRMGLTIDSGAGRRVLREVDGGQQPDGRRRRSIAMMVMTSDPMNRVSDVEHAPAREPADA